MGGRSVESIAWRFEAATNGVVWVSRLRGCGIGKGSLSRHHVAGNDRQWSSK